MPLSGEEGAGTDATVVDLWRFALSSLRMNNARGYLAEFLVAKAVGSTGLQIEWDPYDFNGFREGFWWSSVAGVLDSPGPGCSQ